MCVGGTVICGGDCMVCLRRLLFVCVASGSGWSVQVSMPMHVHVLKKVFKFVFFENTQHSVTIK